MANVTGFYRLLSNPYPVSRILIFKSSTRSLFTTAPPLLSYSCPLSPGGPFHEMWVQLRKEQLEMRLARGFDYGHYVVEMYKPEGDLSRDELINHYIQTLARVVGSEEEARKKIYSVSTRYYNAFSAHLSGETARRLSDLPGVQFVRTDKIEGEPFIDGKVVPYDPEYHEEYLNRLREEEEEELKEPEEEEVPEGCDFEHWVVFMKKQKYKGLSRDEIINSYIKTLADHVFNGSEEKARMAIYSVSTKFFFSFSVQYLHAGYEQLLMSLPNVECVLPDSYSNVENKTYGIDEPFINGEAVPYDPKYHKQFYGQIYAIKLQASYEKDKSIMARFLK